MMRLPVCAQPHFFYCLLLLAVIFFVIKPMLIKKSAKDVVFIEKMIILRL